MKREIYICDICKTEEKYLNETLIPTAKDANMNPLTFKIVKGHLCDDCKKCMSEAIEKVWKERENTI